MTESKSFVCLMASASGISLIQMMSTDRLDRQMMSLTKTSCKRNHLTPVQAPSLACLDLGHRQKDFEIPQGHSSLGELLLNPKKCISFPFSGAVEVDFHSLIGQLEPIRILETHPKQQTKGLFHRRYGFLFSSFVQCQRRHEPNQSKTNKQDILFALLLFYTFWGFLTFSLLYCCFILFGFF